MENSKIVMVLRGITTKKRKEKPANIVVKQKKRTELTTWGIETTKTGLEQTKNEGKSHEDEGG